MIAAQLAQLFATAGLSPCGPVGWGEPCPERQPGIYVVTDANAVIYIGRTKRPLAKRLREFYRHQYGNRSPHRGGQAVLKVTGERWVYWCPTADPRGAERTLLQAFLSLTGSLPLANRRRGDRAQATAVAH